MPHRSRRLVLLALLGLPLAALPSSAAALEFSPPTAAPLPGTPTDAVVTDADLDGDLDVAVGTDSATLRRLALLLNDGSGSFTETAEVPLAEAPGRVAAGDIRGDGRPELFVTLPGSGGVDWWTYVGMSSFVGGGLSLSGTHPGAVGIGDFSGDGLVDAVVADDAAPGSVRLLRGDGSSLLPAPPAFPVGDYPGSIAVADFDEDGRPDFATADTGSNTVTVALAALGNFTPAPGSPHFVGALPNAIATADFDGDGHADLATANRGSNTIAVLLGDGDGGFADAAGSPLAVGTQPESLATGDFNGDGRVDLATVTGGLRVAVLLGDGDGGFAPAVGSPYAVSGFPTGVVAGDLDDDGLDDLVALRGSGDALATLRNASAKPASTAPPLVSGSARVGETLTCADGGWSGSAPLAFTRAWLRDGAPIAGASGATHVVTADDLGASLRCAVTVSNELGATSAESAAFDVPAPPAVALGAASTVTSDSVTVEGLVTPSLAPATWHVEYSPTDAYGATTAAETLPAGRAPQAVSATIAGLQPRTTYHLRLVATNAAGTTASGDMTVTTADAPAPPGDGRGGGTGGGGTGGGGPAPGGDAAPAPAAVRITARPPALGRGRDVALAFAADGAAGFECRLDRGPWIACASPFALRGLDAGDHAVAVRAVGRDGARGAATTVSFQVNPYPPGLTIGRTALRADGGVAALPLACSRREGEGRGACVGTIALRPARGGAVLARGAFRVRAGASGRVRLRLTAAGRRALRAEGARLPVRIAIRARDLAGNRRTLTVRGTLTPLSARATRSPR